MHKRGSTSIYVVLSEACEVHGAIRIIFVIFLRFFTFMTEKREKDGKTFLALKNDFNQGTACGAPVCWSKYTTNLLSFFYVLTLLYLKHNKTEILRIGDEHIEKEYIIGDADGNEITSKLKESIKVCGITYSDNEELAYEKTLQIQL